MLKQIVQALKDNPTWKLTVEGRICLASRWRYQLQCFGLGEQEQLLQECGCRAKLLAASLEDADRHALCMRALFGAVSAP